MTKTKLELVEAWVPASWKHSYTRTTFGRIDYVGGDSTPYRWSVCFRQIIGYLRILASGIAKTREKAQEEADSAYFNRSEQWMKEKKMQMDADELEVWMKYVQARPERTRINKEADDANEADGLGEPGDDAT
jgi:hypothetical protein